VRFPPELQEAERVVEDPETKRRKTVKGTEYQYDEEMEPVCML
jgi:hypothetical protein